MSISAAIPDTPESTSPTDTEYPCWRDRSETKITKRTGHRVNRSAFECKVSMPWTACSVMDERLRFVVKLLDGEPMTEVCRGFSISRKTGYEVLARDRGHRAEALNDRSRSPVLHGLSLVS